MENVGYRDSGVTNWRQAAAGVFHIDLFPMLINEAGSGGKSSSQFYNDRTGIHVMIVFIYLLSSARTC